MKNIALSILAFTLALTSCTVKQTTPLTLSELYSDHMVLQRDYDIHVYGLATPGVVVNAELAGNKSSAKTDNTGKFNVTLPKLKAGGPYEMTVSTKDTSVTFKDILIGDIWVCSGQSNMEFRVNQSENGEEAIANAKYNQIRFIDVPNDLEFKAQDTFRNDLEWKCADVDPIDEFSAVGYYYGVELHKKLNIPIGLIGSNWGGTCSETWTQTTALDKFPEYKEKSDFVDTTKYTVKELQELGKQDFYDFRDGIFMKGKGMDEEWFKPDYDASDWKKIQVPGYWEDQIPEMKDFDGIVWYRKEFDIPKSFIGKDLRMWFSQIKDYDIAWLNGEKIGNSFSPQTWRGYDAPASIVKEKGNVIVFRIYNRQGNGGFKGKPQYFDFYPKGVKKQVETSSGEWTYKISAEIKDTFKFPLASEDVGPNDYPALLYNAMIHPMIQFPIKGAIWYQGEANAERAYQYRDVFPTMITNWRQQWGIGDFPFYFVQLADFGKNDETLGNSDWAELREAQEMTLSLPNTGMATICDIGNPLNIHPTNKTDVGKRLALNAFQNAYGIDTLYSGPKYKKFTVNNSEVVIEYDFIGSGLKTDDGKAPREFLIAGDDKVFYEAEAKIVNNTIVVSCKDVLKPVSVRYAWKNSPDVNLFNEEGLPALPFRTDDWKGITADNREF